ncbi:unnamed protein product [Rotaria socialis]|uniref:Uncharacterized protein n=2 Tax=Rotaria socialis TaxID=392032 RepID=A0A818ZKK6_9BILA|nr:unnamed protein product [Rotaria socialis]CAF3765282.1 unnamed protein product [Rotaria socialis]CAF4372888.1 unnamed protein product [Rotaria socialis]
MRYFIYYPPKRSIRLIDVSENVLVEDVLTLVKQEFKLNTQNIGTAETSIVLNYNGSDLKPNWSLVDLSIPSGSIIRCLYREEKAADLYVFCSYNKQIFKLFDSSITTDTNISTVRKKISDKLGLPLSVYCLETYHNKQRLYDEMKLDSYDIKMHDHIYLKVWRGYEKLLNACIKGFTEQYANDDLTRHYQTQVALYIAAFYGHMELASFSMQQGARSDQPVGEHPSRQWSSKVSSQVLPELLKCPIHIAVERGHVKIVDLFVRQSIICTQVRDPISNHLPYQLALSCSLKTKNREEQQAYRVIYFYLHDKEFNLRIPLNANGEYVSDLLTSTISANAVHRRLSNYVYVSLPFYCKIIRWYERAREKVWKKYGGRLLYNPSQAKRIYPTQGLLGYKVLIDGFNNAFDVPIEQLRNVRSGGTTKSDRDNHYNTLDDDEQEKINKMKMFIKHFALDDRKRAKQKAAENLQQSRRPPLLLSSSQTTLSKNRSVPKSSKTISSSFELSNNQKQSKNIDLKASQLLRGNKNLSAPNAFTKPLEDNRILSDQIQRVRNPSDEASTTLSSQSSNLDGEDQYAIPVIMSPTVSTRVSHSSLTNKLEAVATANIKDSQVMMSSADAYTFSSSRIALEKEQREIAKRQELFAQIEQTQHHQSKETKKPMSTSVSSDREVIDIGTYIPLPDRPIVQRSNVFKSRRDCELRQATVESYERYASAKTRSTAIHCLQEAGCFKGKSWLRQVEISKEMIKHTVKRRIRRANDEINNKPLLLPHHNNTAPTSVTLHRSNTVTVN